MIRDLLRESYDAMRHNRRRTALTMLGMAWGIATVVMLLAYGDGFGRACANIFANFGTKLVIVVPGTTSTQAGGQKAGVNIRFMMDDVDALATNLPQITHITPSVDKSSVVGYENRSFTWNVTGNDPNVYDIRSLKLEQGRFYNMEDQVQRGRVAVIGSEAKEKLFSGRNAVGEHIRLDGLRFEEHALPRHDLVQLSDTGVRKDRACSADDSCRPTQVQRDGPPGSACIQP